MLSCCCYVPSSRLHSQFFSHKTHVKNGLVWLVGECDALGVGKMSKDVGMVIRKSIVV